MHLRDGSFIRRLWNPVGYASNELWHSDLATISKAPSSLQDFPRVGILLMWRTTELKIFMSSETDGYNLNFTKYRGWWQETQSKNLKIPVSCFPGQSLQNGCINSSETLIYFSSFLEIICAVSVWTHLRVSQMAFPESLFLGARDLIRANGMTSSWWRENSVKAME